MWPNSITIPPLLHVFQYYIQICVLNLSHSCISKHIPIHRNLRRRFGDSIQVLDVGWAFEPWKPKNAATRRFKTLSYSATWSLGSFETAIEDDFFNSQKVLVFFFKNVRMIFSLGILDVENFQAANLSWRTTRGQMASLCIQWRLIFCLWCLCSKIFSIDSSCVFWGKHGLLETSITFFYGEIIGGVDLKNSRLQRCRCFFLNQFCSVAAEFGYPVEFPEIKKRKNFGSAVDVDLLDQPFNTPSISHKSIWLHGNGIFTYIWLIFFMVNEIGKYTIHIRSYH